MLAVVYHYSDVLEKWENIKFISEKEKKEMQNKLQQSLGIVRKRRGENKRKLKEKMNILQSLNKLIDRFDQHIKEEHIHKLQSEGKLEQLQLKAMKMEEELKDEHNYLSLQENQLQEYERQYDVLCKEFKVDDLIQFSKSAQNVLAPQMQDMERKEFNIRDTMNEIGRL